MVKINVLCIKKTVRYVKLKHVAVCKKMYLLFMDIMVLLCHKLFLNTRGFAFF